MRISCKSARKVFVTARAAVQKLFNLGGTWSELNTTGILGPLCTANGAGRLLDCCGLILLWLNQLTCHNPRHRVIARTVTR